MHKFINFQIKFNALLSLFICSAAIQAIAAYLDAFQKIADAATNSRGKFKPPTHQKRRNLQ